MAVREESMQVIEGRYPRSVTIGGGAEVKLRLLGPADRAAILEFAQRLPVDDLLFLRANITEASVVDLWLQNAERGRVHTVLAYHGDKLVGESSLHHDETTWTRHIGEVRLLIDESLRGRGLGRVLVDESLAIARLLSLRMLTAQMTLDQSAAQTVFYRLGFRREAVLWDYVIDAEGRTRNLLVATRRL